MKREMLDFSGQTTVVHLKFSGRAGRSTFHAGLPFFARLLDWQRGPGGDYFRTPDGTRAGI